MLCNSCSEIIVHTPFLKFKKINLSVFSDLSIEILIINMNFQMKGYGIKT